MALLVTMPTPPKSEEVRWCNLCAAKGQRSKLRLFQINFDEAVTMCSNTQCVFPLGTATRVDVVERDVSLIPISRKRKAGASAQSTKQKLLRRTSVSAPTSRTSSPHNPLTVPGPTGENRSNAVKSQESKSPFVLHSFPDPRTELGIHNVTSQDNPLMSEKSGKIKVTVESSNDMSKANTDTKSLSTRYIHWKNKDALCWLDVLLCVLVHNQTVRRLVETSHHTNLIRTIIKAFDQAQLILNHASVEAAGKKMKLETSVGMVTAKTGGGNVTWCGTCPRGSTSNQKGVEGVDETDTQGPSVLPGIEKCDDKDLDVRNSSDSSMYGDVLSDAGHRKEAVVVLDEVREQVFQQLQPKLQCKRGQNDSPVFALPLLLRRSVPLDAQFMLKYRWEMVCSRCSHHHTASVERPLPTFPNVAPGFSMTNPSFIRSCFSCLENNQHMYMKYDSLPAVLAVHFVEGVAQTDLTKYDFEFKGIVYRVTGVIQYCTQPNHFIAWNRRLKDNAWMSYNDLKDPITQFKSNSLNFPPSQVHIMLWEQQATSTPVSEETSISGETLSVSADRCPVPMSDCPYPPASMTDSSHIAPQTIPPLVDSIPISDHPDNSPPGTGASYTTLLPRPHGDNEVPQGTEPSTITPLSTPPVSASAHPLDQTPAPSPSRVTSLSTPHDDPSPSSTHPSNPPPDPSTITPLSTPHVVPPSISNQPPPAPSSIAPLSTPHVDPTSISNDPPNPPPAPHRIAPLSTPHVDPTSISNDPPNPPPAPPCIAPLSTPHVDPTSISNHPPNPPPAPHRIAPLSTPHDDPTSISNHPPNPPPAPPCIAPLSTPHDDPTSISNHPPNPPPAPPCIAPLSTPHVDPTSISNDPPNPPPAPPCMTPLSTPHVDPTSISNHPPNPPPAPPCMTPLSTPHVDPTSISNHPPNPPPAQPPACVTPRTATSVVEPALVKLASLISSKRRPVVAPVRPIPKESAGCQIIKTTLSTSKTSDTGLSRLDKTREKLRLLKAGIKPTGSSGPLAAVSVAAPSRVIKPVSLPLTAQTPRGQPSQPKEAQVAKSNPVSNPINREKSSLRSGSTMSNVEAVKPILKRAVTPLINSNSASRAPKVFAGYVPKSQKDQPTSNGGNTGASEEVIPSIGNSTENSAGKVKPAGKVSKRGRGKRKGQVIGRFSVEDVQRPQAVKGSTLSHTDRVMGGKVCPTTPQVRVGGAHSKSAFTKVVPKRDADSRLDGACPKDVSAPGGEENPWDLLELKDGALSTACLSTQPIGPSPSVKSSPVKPAEISLGSELDFDSISVDTLDFDFDSSIFEF